MNRLILSIGILGLSLCLNACATYQVYDSAQSPRSTYSGFNVDQKKSDFYYRYDSNYKEDVNYFIWGLIGNPKISLQKACNGKRAQGFMISSRGIGNFFGSALTLGIWLPRTVEIWCE